MFDEFLAALKNWAELNDDIYGIVIVGSHARDEAHQDSDFDLVILCEFPQRFLSSKDWIESFGAYGKIHYEDWGAVTSVRVWFDQLGEVEFGFTTRDWAESPVDEGTRRVVLDGFKVVYEKSNCFKPLN
jgi:hypothetical protein